MAKLLFIFFLSRKIEQDSMAPHICAISKYTDVLCIELPNLSIKHGKGNNKLNREIQEFKPNLYIFQPEYLFPFTLTLLLPILAKLNNLLLRKSLHRVIQQFKAEQVIVSIRHPGHWGVVDLIDYDLFCYELTDNWHAYPGLNKYYSKILKKTESKLLNKADLVFATSKEFLIYKNIPSEKGFVLHNGVEIEKFSENKEYNLPEDIKNIPEPRIGLIGHLARIVDFELLIRIAKENPSWSLVIVGADNIGGLWFKEKRQLKELLSYSNVHYLGLKQYKDIPQYIKALDVCLMPYSKSEYTRFIYANKVHQYLSLGKHVVSTDLPAMHHLKDVVDFAGAQGEFIELIKMCLNKPVTQELQKKYFNTASEYSLDNRAKLFVKIIEDIIDKKEK